MSDDRQGKPPGYRPPRSGQRADFDEACPDDSAVSYPPGSGLNYTPRDQTPFPLQGAKQFKKRSSSYEAAKKYIQRDRRAREREDLADRLRNAEAKIAVLYNIALINGYLDAQGNAVKKEAPQNSLHQQQQQLQIMSDLELRKMKIQIGLGTTFLTVVGGLLMAAIKIWGS